MWMKVYRTWIDGARVYVIAPNAKQARELAKSLEGWGTGHSLSLEPAMRGTAPGILVIPD